MVSNNTLRGSYAATATDGSVAASFSPASGELYYLDYAYCMQKDGGNGYNNGVFVNVKDSATGDRLFTFDVTNTANNGYDSNRMEIYVPPEQTLEVIRHLDGTDPSGATWNVHLRQV